MLRETTKRRHSSQYGILERLEMLPHGAQRHVSGVGMNRPMDLDGLHHDTLEKGATLGMPELA